MNRLRRGEKPVEISHENTIHIDIETRSRVDLGAEGETNYARDPSTEIVVVRWVRGMDEDLGEWWPFRGEPMPTELRDYFLNPDLLLGAHNARFERLLFNECGVKKYDVPPTQIEQWYCTAYQMLSNNWPRALGDAGIALKADFQKDKRGKDLIRILSIPGEDGTFCEDEDLLEEFSEYCKYDVLTERAISQMTRLVSRAELEDYWACEYVNDAGVRVNLPLARAAVELTEEIAEEAQERIEKLTDGQVQKARGKKLTEYVYELIPEDLKFLMVKKDKVAPGVFEDKVTLDREARERLLEHGGVQGLAREIVEVADSVGSGSVVKFQAMINTANDDGRVRGSYVASGAAATGRYSASKLQVHNFSRDCYKNPIEVADRFLTTGFLPDTPMLALKRLLRSALIPARGKTFICGDWSAIEGCALPWLTLDDRCQPKLDMLHRGEDVYLATATDVYGDPVETKEDPRRQVGKVCELALGYGGGVGSFIVMGASYGVHLEQQEVQRILYAWRRANPGIVDYWDDLEEAALRAFFTPHTAQPVGRVTFYYHPDLLDGVLWCKLPSGRLLSYNAVRVEYDDLDRPQMLSLNASVKKKAGEDRWPERKLYGGLLAENVTQAVCGDLLRECIRELVADAYPVVLHTHDEVMLEAPKTQQAFYQEALEEYMLFRPAWAEGLPLNGEFWVGDYYRK